MQKRNAFVKSLRTTRHSLLIVHYALFSPLCMAKSLPQVMFDFSDDEDVPKEFLSGQPVQPVVQKGKRGRKSLKETVPLDEEPQLPDDEVLFQKAYYTISEVAEMFKIPITQLRYWANAFEDLAPRKTRRGERLFRPQDIKEVELIYDLIRRRKYTIQGAKEFLVKNTKAKESGELIIALQKIRMFLMELKAAL